MDQKRHAACAAIAVDKRMDRLKLIVPHGKTDQWVDLFCCMNVVFPICQFVAQQRLSFMRRIDYLACRIVHQGIARGLWMFNSLPLMIWQTSTAVAVVSGRSESMLKP